MNFRTNMFIVFFPFISLAFVCYAGESKWGEVSVIFSSNNGNTISTSNPQTNVQHFLYGYQTFKKAFKNQNTLDLTPGALAQIEMDLRLGLSYMADNYQKLPHNIQEKENSSALQKMTDFLEQKQFDNQLDQRQRTCETIWQNIKKFKKELIYDPFTNGMQYTYDAVAQDLSSSTLSLSSSIMKSKDISAQKVEQLCEQIINLALQCKYHEEKEAHIQKVNILVQELIDIIAMEENQGYKRIILLQRHRLNPDATPDQIDSFVHTMGLVSRITLAKQNDNLENSTMMVAQQAALGSHWSQNIPEQIIYINHLAISDETKIYLFQLMWWSLVKNDLSQQSYDIKFKSPFLLQLNASTTERQAIYKALQNIRNIQRAKPLLNLTHLLPIIHTDSKENTYYPVFYNHNTQQADIAFLGNLLTTFQVENSEKISAYNEFLKTFELWIEKSRPTTLQKEKATEPISEELLQKHKNIHEQEKTILQEAQEKRKKQRNKTEANEALIQLKKTEKLDTPDSITCYIKNLLAIARFALDNEAITQDIQAELKQSKHEGLLSTIVAHYTTLDTATLEDFQISCCYLLSKDIPSLSQAKKAIEKDIKDKKAAAKERERVALLLQNINDNFKQVETISNTIDSNNPSTSFISSYCLYIRHLHQLACYVDEKEEMPANIQAGLANTKHTAIIRNILRYFGVFDETSKNNFNNACSILSKYNLKEFTLITPEINQAMRNINDELAKLTHFTSDDEYKNFCTRVDQAYQRPELDKEEKRKVLTKCEEKHTETHAIYKAAYEKIAGTTLSLVLPEKDKVPPITDAYNAYISMIDAEAKHIAQTKGFFAHLWNYWAHKKIINNFEAMKQKNLIPNDKFKISTETIINNYRNKSWLSTIGESFSWIWSFFW